MADSQGPVVSYKKLDVSWEEAQYVWVIECDCCRAIAPPPALVDESFAFLTCVLIENSSDQ